MDYQDQQGTLSETVKFIQEAIAQAVDAGDNGVSFSEQVVACGVALRAHDFAAYQSKLSQIERRLSAGLMREPARL